MLCKIWGFHGGDYEERRLLGYKNPVNISHETQYLSATDPCQLMLCKIWGFHSSDYEECRLLGYRIPVRTSQETHYVSATEPISQYYVKFDVSTAVTMKNVVFWDVTPCGSYYNRHFCGTYRLHRQSGKNQRAKTPNNIARRPSWVVPENHRWIVSDSGHSSYIRFTNCCTKPWVVCERQY
jgi:hypothetical protein